MKTIYDVDKNFRPKSSLDKEGLTLHSVLQEPFSIHGIFVENGKFRRLPEAVAKETSEGVHSLHAHTAGGRVRFRTDSPYVSIMVKMGALGKMPHFAYTGSIGFDLYYKAEEGQRYAGSFIPPFDITENYESIIELGSSKLREFTIHFPLYSEVCELFVGLDKDAVIEAPSPYTISRPVVYYGSSITQGGCASRPGSCYQNIISRRLDCDHINLGFSGSAKAEEAMIRHIEELDMSLFVYDYDHNAPTVEHLNNTHEKMFRAIRQKHPDLPIIMLSRPRVRLTEEEIQRLNIIERTYQNALAAGDKNVYFISGKELMRYCGDEGTVDTCHPTDLGFASMAKVLGDLMETISFQ